MCEGRQAKPRLASTVSTESPRKGASPRSAAGGSSRHSEFGAAGQPSIDNQFYSFNRAATMRRERITAPWEEAKARDTKANEEAKAREEAEQVRALVCGHQHVGTGACLAHA